MDDIVDLEIEKIDKIIDKIVGDPEPEEIKAVETNLWKNIKKKMVSLLLPSVFEETKPTGAGPLTSKITGFFKGGNKINTN